MPIATHNEAIKGPRHEEIVNTCSFRRSDAATLALVSGEGVTLTYVAAGRYDVTLGADYNGDLVGAHASWNPVVADDANGDATTLRASATLEDYATSRIIHVRVKDGAGSLAEIPTTAGGRITLSIHMLGSRPAG